MNMLTERVRFRHWPLWTKLLATFIVATALPLLLAMTVVRAEINRLSEEELKLYVQEKGEQRQAAILSDMQSAEQTLNAFIIDPLIVQYMEYGRLSVNTQNYNIPSGLQREIRSRLVETRYFDQVTLVSDTGIVVYSIGESGSEAINAPLVAPFRPGDNLSSNALFSAGELAVQLEDRMRQTVERQADGSAEIYLTGVVYTASDTQVFVITRLNARSVVYNHLRDDNVYRETFSYLLTFEDAFIAHDSRRDDALASIPGVPFRAALNDGDVIDNDLNGVASVTHYAPLRGTDFVIVTEAAVSEGASNLLGLIQRRSFTVFAAMLVIATLIALFVNNQITPPLQDLQDGMNAVIMGNYERPLKYMQRSDEIGETVRMFAAMRDQVSGTLGDLRGSVDARVRDLQATQEVSRLAAAQRDMQTLMDQVVNAIVDLFPNIYHAQIFITHEQSQYAVLRASTGEAGQLLLARGHRLAVGSVSVIGQVTEEGRIVIARDIGASDIHRANDLLPETRAELAIPLRVSEQITGALDVQSKQANSFTEAQVNLLQTLADQIAVAIENARLYTESTRQLQALAATNQQSTYQAWREYMGGRRVRRLESQAGPPAGQESPQMVIARTQALEQGRAVVSDLTAYDTYAIAVPIVLRGQALGTVEWEMPADVMSGDALSLAEDLVERLAVSVDNARLFQESRIAIDRERLVNSITTQLTAQTDVNDILQTAVREIGQALRVPGAVIHLTPGRDENGSNGNGNGSGNGNGHS